MNDDNNTSKAAQPSPLAPSATVVGAPLGPLEQRGSASQIARSALGLPADLSEENGRRAKRRFGTHEISRATAMVKYWKVDSSGTDRPVRIR